MEYWLIRSTHDVGFGGRVDHENHCIASDLFAAVGWVVEQIQKANGEPFSGSQSRRQIASYLSAGQAPNGGDHPIDGFDPETILPGDDIRSRHPISGDRVYYIDRIQRIDHFS